MLRTGALIIILLTFVPGFANNRSVLGKWAVFESEFADPDSPGAVCEFRPDSVVVFSRANESYRGRYRIISKTSPYKIIFTINDHKNKKTLVTHALFHPVDVNTARMGMYNPEPGKEKTFRTESFKGRDSAELILRKMNKNGEVIGVKIRADWLQARLRGQWRIQTPDEHTDQSGSVAGIWEFNDDYSFVQQSSKLERGTYRGVYSIDATARPYIILITSGMDTLHCMFEFIDDYEIKVEFFHNPQKRPERFTEVKESLEINQSGGSRYILEKIN